MTSRSNIGPRPDDGLVRGERTLSALVSAPSEAAPDLVLGVETSVSGRRWLWRPGALAVPPHLGLGLAQRLELPEIVGRLLAIRGIGLEEATHYLVPTLRALLPDPSTLTDMDHAAARLAQAVEHGETIGVFGDYDVDGACSTALMTELLRGFGCVVHTHIPDRTTEGYGPNVPALAGLIAKGARLIVCVDCGTAAHDIFAALPTPADILVLDHHKAEGPPPTILATVNPNRLDCGSGQGMLCATGIAFLTAVALLRHLRRDGFFTEARPAPDLMRFLDLVALATVCDVMPLTGLNRAFVAQGLRIMARGGRPGIAALLEVAQAKGVPSAMTCGFALGPRINAGGRVSDSGLGLRLLLTEDLEEAREIAELLDSVNRQRQQIELGVMEEAIRLAEAQIAAGCPVLLVGGEGWHAGVVGIVAGRLKEKFNRPAGVMAFGEGRATGSARSVPGIDIGAAILAARQSGLLERGGGHAMAAGFSLLQEAVPALHAFLNDRLAAAADMPAAAALSVEGVLTARGATVPVAEQLLRLAPFGQGNDEPLLVVSHVRVMKADRIGKDGATIRAMVEGEGGGRLKALLFRAKAGPVAEALMDSGHRPLHLAGHLRAEEWNGTVSASFMVQDAAWA
ncbi:MAG TPA: single-stranded-DNA-specific exonuclease RecJ [Acidisoma sp.]|uniref:single-stranded-DNA-specific exonuclease RecJ n=1 Tax=Acidisoma sp. TaxID=1872115 RepID=UPI002D0DE939|nr:single-stranded-DNA-specific exonuclease RecJ [Acidisoma sp.]HTI03161.1 single-stranded-DNA-specific exonuclease RecJ [Acidisoma sp.]